MRKRLQETKRVSGCYSTTSIKSAGRHSQDTAAYWSEWRRRHSTHTWFRTVLQTDTDGQTDGRNRSRKRNSQEQSNNRNPRPPYFVFVLFYFIFSSQETDQNFGSGKDRGAEAVKERLGIFLAKRNTPREREPANNDRWNISHFLN